MLVPKVQSVFGFGGTVLWPQRRIELNWVPQSISDGPAAAVVFGKLAGPRWLSRRPRWSTLLSFHSYLCSALPLSVMLHGVSLPMPASGDKVLREGTVTRTGMWVRIVAACARSSLYINLSFICPKDLSVFCLLLQISHLKNVDNSSDQNINLEFISVYT